MNKAISPTSSMLSNFSHHAAELLEAVGADDFPIKLIGMFKELTPVNDGTIILYPQAEMPLIEYFDPPEHGGSENLHLLLKGPFLLDPFYLAGMEKNHGFFPLKQLAPNAFKKSEYYKTYFGLSGVHDECGYVLPTVGDGFVNISLNKTYSKEKFYKKDFAILESLLPFIKVIVKKHWQQRAEDETPTHKNLRQPLQSALDCFGHSVLTDRESQVINKVLRGYSTKAMAEKLSISNETVKLHKKHAYAKLDINSQSELFHMFLDSLMSLDEYKGGDTLSNYL
jgi:DNA-binding CsgD family transcriptional regulator